MFFGAALAEGSWTAGSGECEVSEDFPRAVRRWCGLITQHARQNRLAPDLVAALIWQESGGDPDAYSHSGAVGLMQVMPRDGLATDFICKGQPCFADRPTIRQLKRPSYNISYGTQLLSSLVTEHGGNLREALRQYGPMDVGYYYADTVLALYRTYRNQ
jgi:soluble lytic murein transglycosylase-like protein